MQSSDPGAAVESVIAEPGARRSTPSLRQALRAATAGPHSRLHLHPAFAAIQRGTIDLGGYRALLVRLYGFHVSFEAAAGISNERSAWLREDLTALTMDGHELPTIPRCKSLPAFATPARRLGALYVVEGSTLGGRHLARSLDPLLGSASAGRRFFLGRGSDTDAAWHTFLEGLTASAGSSAIRREIVAAAVETFCIFEEWLRAWRSLTT